MTDTLLEADVESVVIPYEDTEDGDEHHTHLINPPNNLHIWLPGMSIQEVVNIARTTGQVVVALCGYTWVPKRNPEKYDACSKCISVAGELMKGMGE